jgi:hypothetical protein
MQRRDMGEVGCCGVRALLNASVLDKRRRENSGEKTGFSDE